MTRSRRAAGVPAEHADGRKVVTIGKPVGVAASAL